MKYLVCTLIILVCARHCTSAALPGTDSTVLSATPGDPQIDWAGILLAILQFLFGLHNVPALGTDLSAANSQPAVPALPLPLPIPLLNLIATNMKQSSAETANNEAAISQEKSVNAAGRK